MRRHISAIVVAAAILGGAPLVWAAPLRPGGKLPAPAGFKQEGPCVAAMGIPYAREGEWPLGPILGYDEQGNLIFLGYMITQKEFQEGVSWESLPGIAGRTIDHIDITFMPEGHPGHEVPHYDIHLYFISLEAKARICPDGYKGKFGAKVIRYQPRGRAQLLLQVDGRPEDVVR